MVVGVNRVNVGAKKVCPSKLRRYVHDVTVHVYQVWNCVESIEWTSYMAVFSGLQRCAFMMSLYEKESRSLINRTDCEQQLDAISELDQLWARQFALKFLSRVRTSQNYMFKLCSTSTCYYQHDSWHELSYHRLESLALWYNGYIY